MNAGRAIGVLRKMQSAMEGREVRYNLPMEGADVEMNSLVGRRLAFRPTGRLFCSVCGSPTRKHFGQGFCYPCFSDSPEASPCILRPELCEGHLGRGRDMAWELQHHVQPHAVYLAQSSTVKVGITRLTQVPTRWIDQGASAAVIIAITPHRRAAGEMEVLLKQRFTDKTPWQQMLKGTQSDVRLEDAREDALGLLLPEMRPFAQSEASLTEIKYPLLASPEKVTSVNLGKVPGVSGLVTGIKGQYVLFDNHLVMNLRSHAGFEAEMEWE